MKSDREFLDGIYRKAEKMDASKTISQEKVTLGEEKKVKKHFYLPKYAVQLSGSFAVIALMIMVKGNFKEDHVVPGPRTSPIVYSEYQALDLSHPLFEEATEIVEVLLEKSSEGLSLNAVRYYRTSGVEVLVEEFIENNELNLPEGDRAILFFRKEKEELILLDGFTWAMEYEAYENASMEVLTKELLEKIK